MLKKAPDAQTNFQHAMALVELSRLSLESGEKLIDLGIRQLKEHLNNSSDLIGKLASAEPLSYPNLAATQARQHFSKGLADFAEFTNAVTQTQATLFTVASKTWQINAPK